MSFLKRLWRRYGINPFEALLRRAQNKSHTRFLICWNRGLGDIPLGLYALVHRIREAIPVAEITFVTREDLADGFKLLEGVRVVVDPKWKRGSPVQIDPALVGLEDFDQIIKYPDPTGWLMWQLGKLTPKLFWKAEWNLLSESFTLDPHRTYIAVQVQTQTTYGYEKNWPLTYWQTFFKSLPPEYGVILLGFESPLKFEGEGIVDLRGKTSLLEMLSVIKNRCRYLLVPDSGVLSFMYYLDAAYPLEVISLWADPEQGILKQNVSSPNPLLVHTPLIAQNRDLSTVAVADVMSALLSRRPS